MVLLFMRVRAALLLALVLLSLGACNDPTRFRFDPEIVTDTIELGLPSADRALPSALDIVPGVDGTGVGRFPENPIDADQRFDLALRRQGGSLVFVPAGELGLGIPELDRAGITQPITDRSFDAIEDAPGSASFVSDSVVAVQPSAAYVLRSRLTPNRCNFFAKFHPLTVDFDAGTVQLVYAISARCNDPRLVGED